MRRRTLLGTVGAAIPVTVAGCTGSGDDSADQPTNGDDTGSEPGDDADDSSTGDDTDPGEDDLVGEGELTTLESITTVDDRYDPDSHSFSGSGGETTDYFDLRDSITVFIAEHDGQGQFGPKLIDETGLREFRPILEHDPFEGAAAIGTPADPYYLDIVADGDWSIELAQPESLADAIHQLPVEAHGEGYDVVGPVQITGTATVRGQHEDEGTFGVEILDEEGRGEHGQLIPVFNEVGPFDGEEHIEIDAVCWVHVQADSSWTIEIE
ncbi:hypothetical protein [Natronobeatus ordinarius]|uniref:hypothetical protein n=1 Tax=Natronobeatus ordinarius TaxID=2963433 RepID=UPI0020CD8D23|nr:hypothetical protein [Natronobeatus ordinarius]